jgi:hypothetical protein
LKKYIKQILFLLYFIIAIVNLSSARDINLDEIYIKKSSNEFRRLTLEKLETYRKIGAIFVDRNVIFSGWLSGNELFYIKEIDSTNTNYIYKYTVIDRRAVEISRLHGVITVATITPNGRYLVVKRLVQTTGVIPRGERIIVDIKTGKVDVEKSSYAFLDYTIPSEGNSIIYESDTGITELFLDTKNQSELLKRKYYKDIIISNSPVMAFLSPDRLKTILVNGNGGNYKAKLIWNGKSFMIEGISSLSEIFWLDNFRIIYRTGFAGNYSVMLYNIKNNNAFALLKKSLNTNICYSIHSEMISFLKEQVIFLFDKSENKIYNTGIEGEDISFAPLGNRFTALMFKKLFIVNVNSIEKQHIELKRSWDFIFSIYEKMKNKKADYENEYSHIYIDRKTQIYGELTGH